MHSQLTLAVTGQSLIKHDIRQITDPAVDGVRSILRSADLAFTNFEGTILGRHGGWPLKGSYFGASDPMVLDVLQSMGFAGLSLSNNHAFDLGPSGVLSTLEEVEKRGFLAAGLGRNRKEAGRAAIRSVGTRKVALVAMDGGPGPDFMYAADSGPGRSERPGINRLRLSQVLDVDAPAFEQIRQVREKVGYGDMHLLNDVQPDDPLPMEDGELGFARTIFRRAEGFGRNVRVDIEDRERNLAAISAAASDGCVVVAYLHHHHWARNWHEVPDWVSTVAKDCIDAGAAVFLSHGAPVLQPVEIYRCRPIFYSLGNFIFHVKSANSKWTDRQVWESVVAVCLIAENGSSTELRFHPVVIGGEDGLEDGLLERRLAPQRVYGVPAERILGRLREQSAMLGTDIEIVDDVGVLRP
ncbi:CapA family protein [Rhizobium calliandrae]|uniref:CapA family protein n=1 Tax=Rhizobium calliandrae TaxID=1312182 RepID=A0ABT7KJ28_9HYPH|nr:CapA family protein [Rhizobium calliandrae]MDL2408644.1 CapA family protein [Rhizobium calliandrae]